MLIIRAQLVPRATHTATLHLIYSLASQILHLNQSWDSNLVSRFIRLTIEILHTTQGRPPFDGTGTRASLSTGQTWHGMRAQPQHHESCLITCVKGLLSARKNCASTCIILTAREFHCPIKVESPLDLGARSSILESMPAIIG